MSALGPVTGWPRCGKDYKNVVNEGRLRLDGGKAMKKPGRIASAVAASDEAVQRAKAVMQNGRPDEAERMLRELLAKGPRLPSALHALGLALMAQRRAGEAVA